MVRLLVLSALMLAFARRGPWPLELRRVLVVEAATPSDAFPIIVARIYGGQPLAAVQIVLSTSAVSVLTSPLWIRAGAAWLGVA